MDLNTDDYLNNAIFEHNNNIDGIKPKKFYEEPVIREMNIEEPIKRLTPVDLESYKIAEASSNYVHKQTTENDKGGNVNTNINIFKHNLINTRSKQQKDNNQLFNIKDIIQPKNNMNIDSNVKQKASSLVMEFFNDVNKVCISNKIRRKLIRMLLLK